MSQMNEGESDRPDLFLFIDLDLTAVLLIRYSSCVETDGQELQFLRKLSLSSSLM